MLSVEQCKKYLPAGKYTDEQIEQMRDSLYQLADILVEDFRRQKAMAKDGERASPEHYIEPCLLNGTEQQNADNLTWQNKKEQAR